VERVELLVGLHVIRAVCGDRFDGRLPGRGLVQRDGVHHASTGGSAMNNIVYIVGAVVIVLFILGFLGLR
jgi:hypothetical protein